MKTFHVPGKFMVLSFLLLSAFAIEAATSTALFNVRNYGAFGDGKHLENFAINRAIAACANAGGGTVYLPPGKYLSGTIVLKSHVTLDLDAGATILGSENPEDYPTLKDPWGGDRAEISPLIYAEDAENITITGRGTINGQGQIWWKRQWLAFPKKGMPEAKTPEDFDEVKKISRGRPQLIRLVRCNDVVIEHLNLTNSPSWNVHPLFCEFVRVDGLTISTPVPSPNTDGINPESCRNVQIINCRIDTGDDCVTLKSGINETGRRMGRPDENITIANCVMKKGHGGVTIGSEMSGGVHNVTVANCVFQGTDIGIRVKAQRGRGNVVEGLTVANVVMQDVPHPFTITTFYHGSDQPGDVYPVDEGTPRFRDFLFSNITARGAKDAGSITGLRELPIENISFSNVHIQAAKGFTCTNAREISFLDVVINTDEGPALILRNATGIDSSRLRTQTPHQDVPLVDSDASASQ
jgi:polygalacturonase